MPKKPPQNPEKGRPALLVYGNAQAQAVQQIMARIPQLHQRYEIGHVDSMAVARAAVPKCSLLFDQLSGVDIDATIASPRGTKRITFPEVDFAATWPFNCPNPYNAAEPPAFPYGPFPYGDSFLLSCVAQHVPANDAIALYLNSNWPPTWPDLDLIFRQEGARLTSLDAVSDVQIGSYILKHFRKHRLFVAPLMPADILLVELVTRMLAAAFPDDPAIAQADIPGIVSSLGYRDYLGMFVLPVHPKVAQHFQLAWFRADERYNYFDREKLLDGQYYQRFFDYAAQRHGH